VAVARSYGDKAYRVGIVIENYLRMQETFDVADPFSLDVESTLLHLTESARCYRQAFPRDALGLSALFDDLRHQVEELRDLRILARELRRRSRVAGRYSQIEDAENLERCYQQVEADLRGHYLYHIGRTRRDVAQGILNLFQPIPLKKLLRLGIKRNLWLVEMLAEYRDGRYIELVFPEGRQHAYRFLRREFRKRGLRTEVARMSGKLGGDAPS
jgi:hypothetical protein